MTRQRWEQCPCRLKPEVELLERRSLLSTAHAALDTGESPALERSTDQSAAVIHRLETDGGLGVAAMSDQSPAVRFVTRVYETYLGRAPEAQGLAYWVSELRSGLSTEAARSSIMNSPEHLQMLSGTSTVGGGDVQVRPAAARGFSAMTWSSGSVGSASGTSAIGTGLGSPGTGASGTSNLGTGTTLNGAGTSGTGFGMFPVAATGVAGLGTTGTGFGTGATPGVGTVGSTTGGTGIGTSPGQSSGSVGTGIGTSGVNSGTNLTGTGAAGTGTTSTGTTTGTGTNTTGA